MALTRLNEFNALTVLTEAKLEGEFDRIYSNALTLISPLTADLAFGGFRLTGLSAGTLASPAIQYTADADTGIYSSAADTLDFGCGGDRALSLNAASGTGATYPAITPGATAVAPIIAGAGETNTGITLRSAGTGTTTLSTVGAGSVVVSTNGTTRATFDASGLTMAASQPIIPIGGTASAPGIAFDADTGIFSSGADVLDFTSGGDRSLSLVAAAGTGANYITITPAAAGTAPVVGGTGTNAGLTLQGAGTGLVTLASLGLGTIELSTNAVVRASLAATGLTMGTNMPIIAAVASGTPAVGALFRENIIKGVARIDYTGGVPAIQTDTDYNAASVSDDATGQFTTTWDRDFAAAAQNLTLATAAGTTVVFVFADSLAGGTSQVSTWSNNTTRADTQTVSVIALGTQ